MNLLKYTYYRLVGFYKKAFKIEESPGFLIQSCYSWGMLILLISICFYLMSIESVLLWWLGVKINKAFILLTMLPFALFHVFSDRWFSDKKLYLDLCKKYKNERFKSIKGFLVVVFVTLSLPCCILTLYYCV